MRERRGICLGQNIDGIIGWISNIIILLYLNVWLAGIQTGIRISPFHHVKFDKLLIR
jgi:hypothetical protein